MRVRELREALAGADDSAVVEIEAVESQSGPVLLDVAVVNALTVSVRIAVDRWSHEW